MPAIDPTTFRNDFPEFSDEALYPDSLLTLWLNAAVNFVNACRWGSLANIGQELWAAHQIYLSARDQATAAIGGTPGEMTGPVTSKAIDRVSVSYDTASAIPEDAGSYALSSYGIRYKQMASLMGLGGIQL